MVRGIEATILRNDDGFPVQVNLKQGQKKLTVDYPSDTNGFTIKGDEELLPVLNQIYPYTITNKLEIPQPLQTVNVQGGGKTIFYDDFEDTLVKWAGTAAARDATVAFHGTASMSITCGVAVAGVSVIRGVYYNNPNRKMQLDLNFAFADPTKLNYFQIELILRANVSDRIRYSTIIYATGPPENSIAYRDESGNAVTVSTTDDLYGLTENSHNNWHHLTMKTNGLYYGGIQLNEREFANNIRADVTGAGSPDSYLDLRVDNVAGQEAIVYVDDVLLREYE